jgi:hypothetical protein
LGNNLKNSSSFAALVNLALSVLSNDGHGMPKQYIAALLERRI